MSKPKRTPACKESRNGARKRPASPSTRGWRRWIGAGVAAAALAAAAAAVIVAAGTSTSSPASKATGAGAVAPDGSFTTTAGAVRMVSSLRGQPTLLWFVATWCSSCQAGTQAVASQLGSFAAHRVRVVELELANDLGQPGPAIADFGRQLAGTEYHNPAWTFGTASTALTNSYDPQGYLDVYYLLDAAGHITYVNSSPGATMGQLLNEVSKVGSRA